MSSSINNKKKETDDKKIIVFLYINYSPNRFSPCSSSEAGIRGLRSAWRARSLTALQ